MLTVDLLRHGALEGGIKYRGTVDDPLTFQGRQAMDQVWQQLAKDMDYIITSPLSRCATPARAWSAQAGIDCLIEPRLAEIDYGAWEGKSMATIKQEYPGMLERWRVDPTGMCPPGGESPESLRFRLSQWWDEARVQFEGKHILIVAHSGSLRMLIALLLKQPIAYTRSIDMPYACLHRLIYQGGNSRLIFADPPYAHGFSEVLPNMLTQYDIHCGQLVMEESSHIQPSWPDGWIGQQSRRYGDTCLHFLINAPKPVDS